MLEELLAAGHSGADYDAWYIDIGEGDQFGSGFVDINPNSKIPALLDRTDPDKPQRVFESGSILLYLAEKFGAFLPKDPAARTEALNWLFWQMGSAPFLGGGFGHFFVYAPVKIQYAIDRYAMETKRQYDVLDRHFAEHRFAAGDDYSIADMAIYPWIVPHQWQEQDLADFPHLQRWFESIRQRPATQRAYALVERINPPK